MTCIVDTSPRGQRGFTLIEVLVTVVLISVGLLGVAALQLTTLRANQESYARSQAGVLAADILDRMRANPLAFRGGAYDVTWNGTSATTTPTGIDTLAIARASADLLAWQTAINRTLPGDAVDVAGRVVRNGRIVTISIQWRERAEGTGAATQDAGGLREFQTRTEI
jgi:type IV pilus assembly protein PilV